MNQSHYETDKNSVLLFIPSHNNALQETTTSRIKMQLNHQPILA